MVYFIACLLLVAAYVVSIVIYRLFFSPLARFPGPKLAALTFGYEFYYDFFKDGGGRYWAEINRMHDVSGPIVRINPWEVHIRDPEFAEAFKISRKTSRPWWYYRSNGPPNSVLQAGPHELHRMRREAILPVFATPLVMSREHLYEALVQRLLARFRAAKGTGAVLTLGHAFRCLAIDLTCTTNLGYDFGFVDVEDFENDMFKIARTLGRMNMISRHIGHWFFAVMRAPARWAKRAEPVSPGMIRVLRFRNMIDQAVTDQYRAATTNKPTVREKTVSSVGSGNDSFKSTVQHILASNLPAREKELTRVVNEVWLCINAGIDTEGQAIAFATFMLLSHPNELARLRKELAECEKRLGRLPTYQELKELNYLHAVVQESFRLNHPIAGRLPRTDPDNEIQYGDVVIPRGVTVSVSTYDIYLDANIFPDPHRFEPGRWFDPSERKRLRKYVNNYGRGTRSCVGMDVANMGIYLTLGRIFAPSAGFELALHDTLYERDVAFDADFFGAFPKSGSNHIKATVV
ncbi:cytochrome P450 [Colletotrichum tamarilloi]|uniref:Cytochrome P450 n=1 Tax=Colletotrichum tamarilloi TaxID=1209934 RepID=A0ABQ9RUI1_9PEZI|nr:cytochrome P450 [Colletotrichum tamarilloi]KAK1513005.1 cytochrome P450 [Colletotrichum tamarilloi]